MDFNLSFNGVMAEKQTDTLKMDIYNQHSLHMCIKCV